MLVLLPTSLSRDIRICIRIEEERQGQRHNQDGASFSRAIAVRENPTPTMILGYVRTYDGTQIGRSDPAHVDRFAGIHPSASSAPGGNRTK
eukprot:jgi/Bigna1/60660/fgenesh1_kg.14_\